MLFSKRLKITRQSLNLTQEKVASQLHVTQQTISSWENGRSYPDIDSLIQISDYYQISLDTLLKEDIGMKEEIKKQEVRSSLKPVLICTFIINLIIPTSLIVIRLIDQHQTFSQYIVYIAIAVMLVNSYAMISLRQFISLN